MFEEKAIDKSKRLKGKIHISKYGDGYISSPNPEEKDVYVPKKELKNALDGDIVLAHILDDTEISLSKIKTKEGRKTARVDQVVERDVSNVVGEIQKVSGELRFVPKDGRKMEIILDEEDMLQSVEGEIVAVECTQHLSDNRYIAKVKTRLGHKDDPSMDIKEICALHGIYSEFPDEVIDELDHIPSVVSESDKEGRLDLTNRTIFTIDGKDTKDIDDAISLDHDSEGNYIVGVHIADVSKYVTEGSALDMEALKRGTSCYPPGSVFAMLPHKLSNGICSLNEGVERCAISCFIKVSPTGKVLSSKFVESVIKSAKKMNYDDVNAILERNEVPEGYEPFAKILKEMNYLATILRENRELKGSVTFDSRKTKIKLDDKGKVIDVVSIVRGEAEKLIETFMILANEEAAAKLFYNERKTGLHLPGLYRVHEYPSVEQITNIVLLLKALGYDSVKEIKRVKANTVKKILESVRFANEEEEASVKYAAIRNMPPAFYSTENLGHYGLVSPCYTHFTSPIRRYPDLTVHRLLKTFIIKKDNEKKMIDYYESKLDAIAAHCSSAERKAQSAEIECEQAKMSEFMERQIGETFEVVLTMINPYGVQVRLDNGVTGTIFLRDVEGEYKLAGDGVSLLNIETKERLTVGTRLEVRLKDVDKTVGSIIFVTNNPEKEQVVEQPKKLTKKKHGRGKQ